MRGFVSIVVLWGVSAGVSVYAWFSITWLETLPQLWQALLIWPCAVSIILLLVFGWCLWGATLDWAETS